MLNITVCKRIEIGYEQTSGIRMGRTGSTRLDQTKGLKINRYITNIKKKEKYRKM